ncbi:MAG TPA: uracil-DNA glycosylase family protein [Thermoanaerobaculia bacterium]|nr:uracil-DNA glycosylase family protein [Thermoanaerobaculia bacterium]
MSRLVEIAAELAAAVDRLGFAPPVTHVYDPLAYAAAPHRLWLERYGASPKEVLLVGMNPGPWGMAQTGVPFGEVAMVRDWLGIEAPVGRPPVEHPKRPIEGFACRRSEGSGRRLWGWVADRWGTPERFFARFFVHNYCPLVFMEEGGRNRTPDKLPKAEQAPLFAACDRALAATVDHLCPRWVIGIGRFAEERVRAVAAARGGEPGAAPMVGRVLHPSPANPSANADWGGQVERELERLGVRLD